ncbi:OpgC domain-containing protein, partial [Nocardioides sp.]|uniref:OpgC domain-containing protein n=1 Tax=Nocardioides sp. TaxID=35761 RepID=UPI002EDB9511
GARRRAWRYPDASARDDRLDLLRGLVLAAMVAWHLPVDGPLHDLAGGAGALGGLETFVLVSGAAVGLAYPPLAARLGQVAALGRRWRRALVTWLVTLVGVLAVYLLGLLPGLDLDAVATVGEDDLYRQARHLFDYPPPGSVGRAYLFLEMGTWLLVPLALFVALVALAPLAAGPLHRGRWWIVLPASWAGYAAGRLTGAEVLPSLSEELAPLLVWQVLFVHGIALARHRDEVAAFLRGRAGSAVLAVVVLAASGLLWTGAAPAAADPGLPLPRLLVVAAAALVALVVLTTCWRPVAAVADPALGALGRSPLLVVVGHAVLFLVVASVPALRDGPWVGTAVVVGSVVVLALLARGRYAAGTTRGPSSSSRSTTRRVLTR